jgi:hypothetical protein
MGTHGDGATSVDRVAEIRADLDAARRRIAATLDALRYKADIPARLGESVGAMASEFVEHVIDRATPAPRDGEMDENGMTLQPPSETGASSSSPKEHAGQPVPHEASTSDPQASLPP